MDLQIVFDVLGVGFEEKQFKKSNWYQTEDLKKD